MKPATFKEQVKNEAHEYSIQWKTQVSSEGLESIADDFIAGANSAAVEREMQRREVEAVEKAKEGQWIPVEERLPDNENSFSNDVVLFWSKKHGFPMVGCYDYATADWTRLPWERGYKTLLFEDVTHWQPLPPSPKSK